MAKKRVLIVDDSSVTRKIVERTLHQAGFELEVLEASNGCEGLAILQEKTVDLILSDINMPTMDGLEFIRQLQSIENAKAVPVVMISADGSEARIVEAISGGARAFIRKSLTGLSVDQIKEQVAPLLKD